MLLIVLSHCLNAFDFQIEWFKNINFVTNIKLGDERKVLVKHVLLMYKICFQIRFAEKYVECHIHNMVYKILVFILDVPSERDCQSCCVPNI